MSRPLPRAEQLLPIACAAGAVILFGSQLMTIFELNGGPGQTFDRVTAIDQHSVAVLLLAVFALGAVVAAVASGSRPAAYGVAIAGVAALLVFLLRDLPDAGKVGSLGSFEAVSLPAAKTDPVLGFWLELVGALILAFGGAALATLSQTQLRSLADSLHRTRAAAGRSRGNSRPSDPLRTATEAREDLAKKAKDAEKNRGGREEATPSGAENRAGRGKQAKRRRERT